MVTACIDLGNSLHKAAVFTDGSLSGEFVFSEDLILDGRRFIEKFNPDRIILASVADHPQAFEDLLSAKASLHKLSILSRLNFKIEAENPQTIGADRLALAAAAVDRAPGVHNLVIAMGSCITYNFIDRDRRFLGGAISPGLSMRFRSLHQHTAKLPLITFETDRADGEVPLLGSDTRTNILSGVINGIAFELEGMISAYRQRYAGLNIQLTGGNAGYFAGQLKNGIFADSNLLFKGLYVLSGINIA